MLTDDIRRVTYTSRNFSRSELSRDMLFQLIRAHHWAGNEWSVWRAICAVFFSLWELNWNRKEDISSLPRRLSTVCGHGIFNICFVLIFFILFRTSTTTYSRQTFFFSFSHTKKSIKCNTLLLHRKCERTFIASRRALLNQSVASTERNKRCNEQRARSGAWR